MDECRIGCEDCKKCFAGCEAPFPDKFVEGGAETCQEFEQEKDVTIVYNNMEKYVGLTRDKLAAEGIYV